VDAKSSRGKDRTLTQESLDLLLSALDPDPKRAGEEYNRLREKLVRFFEWQRGKFPDDYADETLDRVARKIKEGEEMTSVSAYAKGVAKRLLKEKRRLEEKEVPLDDRREPPTPEPNEDPSDRLLVECFEECLRKLPRDDRETVVRYYEDEKGRHIKGRARLAQEKRVSPNALRIDVCRLRGKVKKCAEECIAKHAEIESGI